MDLDLGEKGLVGLLTPRENPTVEPEMSVLLPPDTAFLTARMQSGAGEMNARLVDYARDWPRWLDAFGQVPLDAVGFACTGTSYLLGPDDPALPAEIVHTGRTLPVLTAAGAVEAALRQLGARSLAVVSPYPPSLTDAALAYWKARGFAVTALHVLAPAPGYHPIYGQTNATALAAVVAARASGPDAVLVMGTGAPTLGALAMALKTPGPPVVGSNLSLGWRLSAALGGEEANSLESWLRADAPWVSRLAQRFPAALARAGG